MSVKIELKIDLCFKNKLYYLYIKVIDKDKRFDADDLKQNDEIYKSRKGDFYISSSIFQPEGNLTENSFFLPANYKINSTVYRIFNSDIKRKEYLKKLILTIKDWSDYWFCFFDDDKSKLIIDDDIILIDNPDEY